VAALHRDRDLSDAPRQATGLVGLFAGLALVLAAAGIYGVASCLAAGRHREIAIRMALGAELRDILGLVYRSVLIPAAAGLLLGAAASLWLARLLQALLYGVGPHDPGALLGSALTLLAIAILAAAAPAVRSALTDPAKVLRRE
jgi:putative ABC transport system permease protein